MSRRREIRMSPDEQSAFLQQPLKAALATLDQDGFPHVVAMNFVAKDGALYMTSYAKAQKVLNIRRNPKVGVMIESGGQYAEYRGLMIRGHCEIIEDPELVMAIIQTRQAGKTGASTTPERGEATRASKRVGLKVIPEKMISWDHTKLGGRY